MSSPWCQPPGTFGLGAPTIPERRGAVHGKHVAAAREPSGDLWRDEHWAARHLATDIRLGGARRGRSRRRTWAHRGRERAWSRRRWRRRELRDGGGPHFSHENLRACRKPSVCRCQPEPKRRDRSLGTGWPPYDPAADGQDREGSPVLERRRRARRGRYVAPGARSPWTADAVTSAPTDRALAPAEADAVTCAATASPPNSERTMTSANAWAAAASRAAQRPSRATCRELTIEPSSGYWNDCTSDVVLVGHCSSPSETVS